jgi:hypothetical protein
MSKYFKTCKTPVKDYSSTVSEPVSTYITFSVGILWAFCEYSGTTAIATIWIARQCAGIALALL